LCKMLLTMIGAHVPIDPLLWIAPPILYASLASNTHLMIEVNEVPLSTEFCIPPPVPAKLPVNIQCINSGELAPPLEAKFMIAPPPAPPFILNSQLVITGELVPLLRPEL